MSVVTVLDSGYAAIHVESHAAGHLCLHVHLPEARQRAESVAQDHLTGGGDEGHGPTVALLHALEHEDDVRGHRPEHRDGRAERVLPRVVGADRVRGKHLTPLLHRGVPIRGDAQHSPPRRLYLVDRLRAQAHRHLDVLPAGDPVDELASLLVLRLQHDLLSGGERRGTEDQDLNETRHGKSPGSCYQPPCRHP